MDQSRAHRSISRSRGRESRLETGTERPPAAPPTENPLVQTRGVARSTSNESHVRSDRLPFVGTDETNSATEKATEYPAQRYGETSGIAFVVRAAVPGREIAETAAHQRTDEESLDNAISAIDWPENREVIDLGTAVPEAATG